MTLQVIQLLEVMEAYGHGEIMFKEDQDKIIEHNIHHQFKQVLILHGLFMTQMTINQQLLVLLHLLQSKLMEHYGHGDIMIMGNQDIINKVYLNHHQFKFMEVVLPGRFVLRSISLGEQSKLMELYGYGEGIIMENWDKIIK